MAAAKMAQWRDVYLRSGGPALSELLQSVAIGDDETRGALSDDDLKKLVPGVRVMTYPGLCAAGDVPRGFTVLLYLTESQTTGHWVGLWRGSNQIQYFDPLGLQPGAPLRWLNQGRRAALHEQGADLQEMLRRAAAQGTSVSSNPTDFQAKNPKIETCGRHVACWMACQPKMTFAQYAAMVRTQEEDPDTFVTQATDFAMH